uniref:Uncharacterized protein n=1 Tax=Solanum lycopersicum TaxID=4081 RepID=A0A3Q7FJB8_SOLLC
MYIFLGFLIHDHIVCGLTFQVPSWLNITLML